MHRTFVLLACALVPLAAHALEMPGGPVAFVNGMLLDGYEAPNAGGRSVASVVENRILGIVGNSLVMPVAPGQKLDPTYEFAESTPEDLRHLYAVESAPKARISLPTPGVFAEAVMGKCNSCEKIDNSRFWQFEEFPLPDTPTPISAASTDTRRSTPVSTARISSRSSTPATRAWW